ncbi:Protein of unknown function [Gryllus bimaculatus]|nr:Protein of unknown function [Gryllus bimaculatus]
MRTAGAGGGRPPPPPPLLAAGLLLLLGNTARGGSRVLIALSKPRSIYGRGVGGSGANRRAPAGGATSAEGSQAPRAADWWTGKRRGEDGAGGKERGAEGGQGPGTDADGEARREGGRARSLRETGSGVAALPLPSEGVSTPDDSSRCRDVGRRRFLRSETLANLSE